MILCMEIFNIFMLYLLTEVYKYVKILHNSDPIKKEDILSIYKEREKYGRD